MILNNYKKLEGLTLNDGWSIKKVVESKSEYNYKIVLVKDGFKSIKWSLERTPSEDGEYFLFAEDSCYPMLDYELNLNGVVNAIESTMEDIDKMRWIHSGNGIIFK